MPVPANSAWQSVAWPTAAGTAHDGGQAPRATSGSANEASITQRAIVACVIRRPPPRHSCHLSFARGKQKVAMRGAAVEPVQPPSPDVQPVDRLE